MPKPHLTETVKWIHLDEINSTLLVRRAHPFSKSSEEVVNHPRQRFIHPKMEEFVMPLGSAPPLAPRSSLQSSSIEMERMRREGRACLLLGGWVFDFLRQRILILKMFFSSQGTAIAICLLVCWNNQVFFFAALKYVLIFFVSFLNDDITIYFWNTDQNTSFLFLFALLSVLLCCWHFHVNTSAVFLTFSISLWRRQLRLCISILMLHLYYKLQVLSVLSSF